MSTPNDAIVLWDQQLAKRPPPAGWRRIGREHVLLAVLAAAAIAVFGCFVSVLQQDVQRAQGQQAALQAHEVAEADCERSEALETRTACLAQLGDASAVAHATPENDVAQGGGMSLAAMSGSN